jgi:hypothetical protein
MIVPKANARIDHPDLVAHNVLVSGVGHMSLPIHRRAVHVISMTLAQLDADGSTLTPGVTSIASDRPGESKPAPRVTSGQTAVRGVRGQTGTKAH